MFFLFSLLLCSFISLLNYAFDNMLFPLKGRSFLLVKWVLLTDTRTFMHGTLYIEFDFTLDHKKPEIVIKPGSLTVIEKMNAISLTCTVISGSPIPTLIWFHETQPVGRCTGIKFCRLKVKEPKYGDHEGAYSCLATNAKGVTSKVAHITVIGKMLLY